MIETGTLNTHSVHSNMKNSFNGAAAAAGTDPNIADHSNVAGGIQQKSQSAAGTTGAGTARVYKKGIEI